MGQLRLRAELREARGAAVRGTPQLL